MFVLNWSIRIHSYLFYYAFDIQLLLIKQHLCREDDEQFTKNLKRYAFE